MEYLNFSLWPLLIFFVGLQIVRKWSKDEYLHKKKVERLEEEVEEENSTFDQEV